jgi:hypothetical protein
MAPYDEVRGVAHLHSKERKEERRGRVGEEMVSLRSGQIEKALNAPPCRVEAIRCQRLVWEERREAPLGSVERKQEDGAKRSQLEGSRRTRAGRTTEDSLCTMGQ